MTLTDLINKYNGQPCEMGGSSKALNQCVDLANAWLFEGLEQPKLLGTNAIDFPEKIGDKWEWIPNTTTNVPVPGDLVIFNIGNYGHISIFMEGDSLSFKSFDQNYPLKSLCHVQSHKYTTVIGWLHFKGSQTSMNDDEKRAIEIFKNFKQTSPTIKDGNYEGAMNALIGWSKDYFNSVVEIGRLKDLVSVYQSETTTANKHYKAMLSMMNSYSYLVNLFLLKMNKKDLEAYLNTEIPKIISSQNQNEKNEINNHL